MKGNRAVMGLIVFSVLLIILIISPFIEPYVFKNMAPGDFERVDSIIVV